MNINSNAIQSNMYLYIRLIYEANLKDRDENLMTKYLDHQQIASQNSPHSHMCFHYVQDPKGI
jgi:hypothetical protein